MKIKHMLAVLLCTFLTTTAAQAATQTQTMTYDVYAGGIHALDARLSIKSDSKKYDIGLTSATHGFLKKVAPWAGSFQSNGHLKNNKPLPLKHVSSSTWKGDTEEKSYRYDGEGNFLSYKKTETTKENNAITDKTPDETDPELTRNTTDTLSATLDLLITLSQTKTCSGESLIFDGDRSFKLLFTETSINLLKKSKYNIYDGETISCQVEVVPDKGKWRKKPRGWLSIQEQGRQKGSLPTIWLGKMDGASTYIPVKIRIKTNYGTLFMHLTSYNNQAASQ